MYIYIYSTCTLVSPIVQMMSMSIATTLVSLIALHGAAWLCLGPNDFDQTLLGTWHRGGRRVKRGTGPQSSGFFMAGVCAIMCAGVCHNDSQSLVVTLLHWQK